MKIASVVITNFRCLGHVRVDFDDVTTFIGPNGAGKSSILRALEWFFNGGPADLSDQDVYAGAPADARMIEVEVTFEGLTAADRAALGEKYAPVGVDTFTVWRRWEDGVDKITGKALAFTPFERVRAATGAAAKREALEAARDAHPELGLPLWSSMANVAVAMDTWEREHPQHLEEAEVSDTHFFGFNGQGKLSGLFDYVLVTADLRASEESLDGRGTIVGRILERAIDRSAASSELADLAAEVSERQQRISETHLSPQLVELADQLTNEVSAFTPGRRVRLQADAGPLKAQPPKVFVSIVDDLVETSVDRQGHGFQRTLLISALKMLAGDGAKEGRGSVICLAVEEPELFQHPSQARVFASVLRELAEQEAQEMQVTYATHSPYFIEPRYFDQLRRVTRARRSDGHDEVLVTRAGMDAVLRRLDDTVREESIKSRWHQVCIRHLSEALFAEGVLLVEGEDDRAILEGFAARKRPLALDGLVVTPVNGKENLFIPHAILSELGIPTIVVFDNDRGYRTRAERDGKKEETIGPAESGHKVMNRKLATYLDAPVADYPSGLISARVAVIEDTMETLLGATWSDWDAKRLEIIDEGRGVSGKNAATYGLAAQECSSDPSGLLPDIILAARALV